MSQEQDQRDPANFKPGVYAHYKGSMYTALMLVHHHDSRELLVVYLSHSHGTLNVREWYVPGSDSWTDMVRVPCTRGGELTYDDVPRFKLVAAVGVDLGAR